MVAGNRRKCALLPLWLLQLRSKMAALLCVLLSLLGAASVADDALGLSMGDVRLRLPLPGQTTAVLYFDLTNHSASDYVLVGVGVGGAKRAEMHQHQHVDGMMRMREVKTVLLKAGSTIEFKPHGYHVMAFEFMDSAAVPSGKKVEKLYPVELKFEGGSVISAQAQPIRY